MKRNGLCGLVPLAPQSDQTANGTGNTNNTVVEVKVSERRHGRAQVANIRQQLGASSQAFPEPTLATIHTKQKEEKRGRG